MSSIDESKRDAWLAMQAANRASESAGTGNNSGSGGGFGELTDDWKASVDKQLSQLHDDFRKIITWLIGCIAVPLLAIIGLYVYTGSRFDLLQAQNATAQVAQERANGNAQALTQRVSDIDSKLDGISGRLDRRR